MGVGFERALGRSIARSEGVFRDERGDCPTETPARRIIRSASQTVPGG